ncbi:Tudor/PWWP/MBT superfamily protein [Quillaja saponaria]|uniref:Tudor/PWWP/MBT superfamily protein n=1 Tax=Quillaja saponaria TaxID=32244 RepID=A0AAD7L5I3_QUISA|nr:Tudor/PWWP/MBT superfamily protein [Quillaja saponaria]
MGLDELSEGCLVSPRSGTPVKLLGREDASVDWYNLEKSKRVKAFRCGEYDDCIEKAKAAAASSNKKVVKYARREDAILHALELENARLGKEPLNFISREDKSGSELGDSAKESATMSRSRDDIEDVADVSNSEDNSNSAPELSQSGISFEDPNHNCSSKVQSEQGRRRRTPNDSEDDGTEGVKRMRGLDDLGLCVVSKTKVQAGGALELVVQDGASPSNSNIGSCLANGTSVNGGRCNSSTLKRKRSQVPNTHEYLKRRNRRRPLTKVLESTAMVSVPVVCDQLPSSSGSPLRGLSEGKVSAIEFNEPNKSSSVAINNSDSTVISCENGTSLNDYEHGGDASHVSCKVKDNETSTLYELAENDASDKLFDVPFVGVLGKDKHAAGLSPILVPCSSGRPEVGALGWQSCNGSQVEAIPLRNDGLNESGSTSSAPGVVNNSSDREEKGTSKWQSKGKRNSRHTSKSRKQVSRKYVNMDDVSNPYLTGIDNSDGLSLDAGKKFDCNGVTAIPISYNCTSPAKSKPVAEGLVDGFRDLNKHTRGTAAAMKLLSDGSLTPQRSLPYRQSRFTINSRYQTADFPGRNFCSEASLYDVKLEVKASYRPQHVPLVSLMSKLNGKAIVGHPLTIEVLEEGYCNEVLSSIKHDMEVGDMHYAVKSKSLSDRTPTKNSALQSLFLPGKSSKMKKSGLLTKKIRKLSSLTSHKQSEEERKPVVDKLKGPVIACIPIKVVFSRINEAVNGLAGPTHRVLPTSNL